MKRKYEKTKEKRKKREKIFSIEILFTDCPTF